MTSHPPPVPPEQRSPHNGTAPAEDSTESRNKKETNLAEQGRQGNISQNTTNKGFQQDR